MNLRSSPRTFVFFLLPWAAFSDEPSAKSGEPRPAEPRMGSPLSSHISAAIRAGLPAYAPHAPTPEKSPAPGSTEAIVFLPKVVVHGSKVPDGSEWQMLSPLGKADYLRKRYPGFVVPGGDPLTESTPNYASQMRRDDVRKENLAAMEDTVEIYRVTGDLKRSKELKEEMQRALIRAYDWRTERLDRAYNNDRR